VTTPKLPSVEELWEQIDSPITSDIILIRDFRNAVLEAAAELLDEGWYVKCAELIRKLKDCDNDDQLEALLELVRVDRDRVVEVVHGRVD